jgi:hypothetical protein
VGDQQRPVGAAGCAGELVPVDEAHAGFHRIDPEAGPGDVEERQRRHHVAVHPLIGAQHLDAAFEDEG